MEKNAETRQVYEIQSELIKLMLNSCYGFTLCNVASTKFKTLENRKNIPNKSKARDKIKNVIQLGEKIFLVELNKTINDSFQTLLGQVGSYILFHSKIILIKRLYFLLKYLNPTKAQLLYMDTDSAHFLVKHPDFIDNVDKPFKDIFRQLVDKHFDSGSKLSGIWVKEGFFERAYYIGEKSYILSNDSNPHYLTHMKGLNQNFQHQFVKNQINPQKYPVISYNIFQKSNDGLIFKTFVSKNLFQTYVPSKRYFVTATGSVPLNMTKNSLD
jgi:DNA polymerase elongation subunit (family B)